VTAALEAPEQMTSVAACEVLGLSRATLYRHRRLRQVAAGSILGACEHALAPSAENAAPPPVRLAGEAVGSADDPSPPSPPQTPISRGSESATTQATAFVPRPGRETAVAAAHDAEVEASVLAPAQQAGASTGEPCSRQSTVADAVPGTLACSAGVEQAVASACEAIGQPRALRADERGRVLEVLSSERFCDAAPRQVYAELLDEGVYLASVSTMYRILRAEQMVRERRDQLRHPVYRKPELLATGPNQVWSWDITKLLGPVAWSYFYLYVILDIYSRYVVGYLIADRESASLAHRLIDETCDKQRIVPGQLGLHSDRGPSMKSGLVAQLLAELGVTKTHSRPYVSDDNPFSESQFKTFKYRPGFPDRFGSIEDARAFCRTFFDWYNRVHRHSGIGLYTPEDVHYGRVAQLEQDRLAVLLSAYAAHPERFVNKVPRPLPLPEAVWINPPNPSPEPSPERDKVVQ